MNGDDQTKIPDVTESISKPSVEVNDARPQEPRSETTGGSLTKRRKNYDGSRPLDYPGHEAVAQFLAAPKQFRQFKSATALAKHFDVSRMTVYRWAQDLDVARRVDWLSIRNRVLGDFLPRREWAGIVQAQVAAALAGDTRAAIFCLNRAWPEVSIFDTGSLQHVIEGANNVEILLEADAISESDVLDTAKENFKKVEGKDPQK